MDLNLNCRWNLVSSRGTVSPGHFIIQVEIYFFGYILRFFGFGSFGVGTTDDVAVSEPERSSLIN